MEVGHKSGLQLADFFIIRPTLIYNEIRKLKFRTTGTLELREGSNYHMGSRFYEHLDNNLQHYFGRAVHGGGT